MYKAYKYRIYPNKEQQTKMNQFFGCCRFVYNKYIEWYSDVYKSWKENGTDIGKTPLLTEFKKNNEFLKECDNAALAYSRSNFERAIKDFIKSKNGKRKGKRLGFPKFKSKHKSKMTYKTCDAHGGIRFVDDSHIKLPKMGLVKCIKHREFNGIIKAVTVEMKPSGKYYISVMVECLNEIKLKINKKNNYNNLNVVGLDMSLSDFVVSSHEEDNMIIKYIRNYRKNEKHLSKLQRKLSRKEKGSKNIVKSKRQVAVLHEKIANQRKDFITKTALYFARKYDVIVLEDINLQNMSRTLRLGKSVTDLGFGEFRTILEQKCKEYDTTIIYADKWYPSSKTCSSCGMVNKSLKLSDREWVCTECGTYHNRDFNAALNLEHYFINHYNTVGTTEINACGDNASTLRAIVMQVMSLNQEAPFL
jgi:putative transposase